MSANLEELESERGNLPPTDDLDSNAKRQIEVFVQRYCFGYQSKVAGRELEAMIKQIARNR